METIDKNESAIPEATGVHVTPEEIVNAEELTREDLAELLNSEKASENPIKFKQVLEDFAGAAIGFLGAGYLNTQVLQYVATQAPSTNSTIQNLQLLLGASAALLVAEVILGSFIIMYARKRSGSESNVLDALGVGIMVAGIGSFANYALAYSGVSGGGTVPAPAFPAVSYGSGRPLVPSSRAVGV